MSAFDEKSDALCQLLMKRVMHCVLLRPCSQGKKSGKTALMYALESRDIVLIENIVALVDPARLRTYLKTQAFDGSTCLRIMENLQRGLDSSSRQRLHACLKISSRRDNSAS